LAFLFYINLKLRGLYSFTKWKLKLCKKIGIIFGQLLSSNSKYEKEISLHFSYIHLQNLGQNYSKPALKSPKPVLYQNPV